MIIWYITFSGHGLPAHPNDKPKMIIQVTSSYKYCRCFQSICNVKWLSKQRWPTLSTPKPVPGGLHGISTAIHLQAPLRHGQTSVTTVATSQNVARTKILSVPKDHKDCKPRISWPHCICYISRVYPSCARSETVMLPKALPKSLP